LPGRTDGRGDAATRPPSGSHARTHAQPAHVRGKGPVRRWGQGGRESGARAAEEHGTREEATGRHASAHARLRSTPPHDRHTSEARGRDAGRRRKAGGRAGGRRHAPAAQALRRGGGARRVGGRRGGRKTPAAGPTWRRGTTSHTLPHARASPRRLGAAWRGAAGRPVVGAEARGGGRRHGVPWVTAGGTHPQGAGPARDTASARAKTPGRGDARLRWGGVVWGRPRPPTNPKPHPGPWPAACGSREAPEGPWRPRTPARARSLLLHFPSHAGAGRAPPSLRAGTSPCATHTHTHVPTRTTDRPSFSPTARPRPTHLPRPSRGWGSAWRAGEGKDGENGGPGTGRRGVRTRPGLEAHRHLHLGGRRTPPAAGQPGAGPCEGQPPASTPTARGGAIDRQATLRQA